MYVTRLNIDKKYLTKAILLTLTLAVLCVTGMSIPGAAVPAATVVGYKYGTGYGLLISTTALLIGLALSAAIPGIGAGLAFLITTLHNSMVGFSEKNNLVPMN